MPASLEALTEQLNGLFKQYNADIEAAGFALRSATGHKIEIGCRLLASAALIKSEGMTVEKYIEHHCNFCTSYPPH